MRTNGFQLILNATQNSTFEEKEILYIFAPDGLFAINETKNGVNKMYYLSSDHLGSINLIVDGSNGNVVDDLSYDSWGRNRNPIDWSPSNFTLSSVTDRGYTSHEQLTNFGLINMNGRIYDPMTLGFLSPDPFVQNPSNSQNYNRFSYVLNNPLKYVDPSGYVAMNPWYQYQAGPKTFYTWMPDYHTDGTYPDNQGRIWKYHGETINTPGFYGDETGMWISKLNEHNELIYNYNELRQVVQNNANSNSFFSSFSMGAGTLRVEGEGNGRNNTLGQGDGTSYAAAFGLASLRLAPGWVVAAAEPTFIGEVVMGVATIAYTARIVHANSKKSQKPNIVYEIYRLNLTEGYETMKFGVSSQPDFVRKSGNPRPEYQCLILNKVSLTMGEGNFYWYSTIAQTPDRASALDLERKLVEIYMNTHNGRKPPMQKRP